MKKLSAEELAEVIKVKGATEEEKAVAIAVIHSLLANPEQAKKPSRSGWQRGLDGLRQQLDSNWEGPLRS
jgi:hypothetical protein